MAMAPPESVVLTVEEAASQLRISRGSAYEAARRGDLPTLRIGRRLLVPRVALERLLEQAGKPAGAPPVVGVR